MPELRGLLEQAVEDGVTPGAVLRVESLDDGAVVTEVVVGRTSSQPLGPPATPSTRYDLASLTKLYTVTVALRQVQAGALALSGDVGELLGEGRGGVHRGMTVLQLLEHRSGLPAWLPLYKGHRGAAVVRAALAVEPEAPPGARHRYSDIGFFVLQAVLERVTGERQDALVQALDLPGVTYRPVGCGDGEACAAAGIFAATERCPRRGLVCGEVHDDNAWAAGGIAPHAGLFGCAADVAALARRWWSDRDFLDDTLRARWLAAPRELGTHHLGWDTVSPAGSSAGALSARSRGHLGFTGGSLWVDPERRMAVTLLTNRVHPRRDDDRIRALRPRVHDLVAKLG